MLKILIYSVAGEGIFLCERLQDEGHEVTLFVSDVGSTEDYDNMVNKIHSIDEMDLDTDVIFVDDVGDGKKVDDLKRQGFLVTGGGEFHDAIEEDRKYGLEIMKKVGINVPETFEFNSIDEGIEFIRNNPERYVIKVNDSAAKYTSHVGKDADDLINVMTHMKEEGLIKEKSGYILQEFIEGYEISIEGWFNGNNFIPGLFNHCIEQKKFLVGDLGPTTGSEGSVVFGGKNTNAKLVENIMRVSNILRKYKYNGAIDLNTIIDKEGTPWALEWCGRVGYICFENFVDLYDGDLGELFYQVAAGEGGDLRLSDDMCVGVGLSCPPYPVELEDSLPDEVKDEVMKILGKRCYHIEVSGFEDFQDHCYLSSVMLDEEGKYRVSAYSGSIGAICGRGSTIDEAKALVYDRLKKINLPSKQYRTDIGNRGKEWFKLQSNRKMSETVIHKSAKYDEEYITQLLYSEERKIMRGR